MKIDFEKYADGLIQAVVQDAETLRVLTVGFMNRKALKKTEKLGKVMFYSRSANKLLSVSEKNYLKVVEILQGSDKDSILIKAIPNGKHFQSGTDTHFKEKNNYEDFLFEFEKIAKSRKLKPVKSSLTSNVFKQGINKIAKKLGEEAVELVIEAKDEDEELFKAEAADMLYYFMLLLVEKDISLKDVLNALKCRRR